MIRKLDVKLFVLNNHIMLLNKELNLRFLRTFRGIWGQLSGRAPDKRQGGHREEREPYQYVYNHVCLGLMQKADCTHSSWDVYFYFCLYPEKLSNQATFNSGFPGAPMSSTQRWTDTLEVKFLYKGKRPQFNFRFHIGLLKCSHCLEGWADLA